MLELEKFNDKARVLLAANQTHQPEGSKISQQQALLAQLSWSPEKDTKSFARILALSSFKNIEIEASIIGNNIIPFRDNQFLLLVQIYSLNNKNPHESLPETAVLQIDINGRVVKRYFTPPNTSWFRILEPTGSQLPILGYSNNIEAATLFSLDMNTGKVSTVHRFQKHLNPAFLNASEQGHFIAGTHLYASDTHALTDKFASCMRFLRVEN
jgi:hypothetical protein